MLLLDLVVPANEIRVGKSSTTVSPPV